MIKRAFLLITLASVWLFARGDAPIVFEDRPIIDGKHVKIKIKRYKKHKKYKRAYKYTKKRAYKRYKSYKNDALVAKDELILPNN